MNDPYDRFIERLIREGRSIKWSDWRFTILLQFTVGILWIWGHNQ